MSAAVFAVTFAIVAVVLIVLFGDDRSVVATLGSQRLVGWVAVGIAAVLAAVVVGIYSRRRRIARAADNAAVATLAAGVKAKRKVGEKASSYRQRIIDRADEA